METLWFCLIGFMLATYVVLDGFDMGAGVLHLFVARTEKERELVLRAIGPVWDGNEVWLLASGGAIVLAFPTLYATSFSGFYLPLMMVLWLLIWRSDSEVRRRITRIIPIVFVLVLVLWVGSIARSISVRPLLTQNFHARPLGAVFQIASFLAICVSFSLHGRHMAGPAFLTSA